MFNVYAVLQVSCLRDYFRSNYLPFVIKNNITILLARCYWRFIIDDKMFIICFLKVWNFQNRLVLLFMLAPHICINVAIIRSNSVRVYWLNAVVFLLSSRDISTLDVRIHVNRLTNTIHTNAPIQYTLIICSRWSSLQRASP